MKILTPAQVLSQVPTGCFINGQWQPSSTGQTFAVYNPATEEALVDIANASTSDGIAALDAACAAQNSWAATAARQRAEILRRAFDLVTEKRDLFAQLMTLEMGKPLDQAQGEVTYGAEFLRWFSEEAPRVAGRYFQTPEGNLQAIVTKRPVGPCLFITPWNFPLAMATRKVGPALAAGCTVVIKPAALTPLTTLLFVEVLRQSGLPAGVVNVVPTQSARSVTGPIIADSRLRKVSFTGSTEVGKVLLRECADNVLRTSMELGGCAPFIIFEDADVDKAVAAATAAKLRNMGQACNAASRFYVHSSLAQEFTEKLAHSFAAQKVDDGLVEGCQVGPLVSQSQLDDVAALVRQSVSQGAKVVIGGTRVDRSGYFFPPTVLAGLTPDNVLLQEEVFGPVAPICTFDAEEEVLAWANDSLVGLAGYVFTSNIDRMIRLGDKLQVGMIGFNSGPISNAGAPFGGVKQSGLGREGGVEGIEEYLETVYLAIPRQ